ncbi:patatin-like phospholipase family protein [Luteolibacter sp. GHJ8]|uniref:Patatin-like phospholipase family protein n=1 Tax=Luteolibacter rhizosphaerae TaxID=2989719 RepID=A0ABT3G6S8_9BACT|nr:patatin-like phospholipase family protein [Luteolibacter rhizosphaerae]MCW1915543.1 patatin-like phospholipase family protein [Luteolibacter rhizosphaerae]
MEKEEVTPGLAVALGSSLLGYYAHAGFLNGLAAAGLHPAKIAGASAGALAGSLYASGLRGDELRTAILDSALRWSFFDWGSFLRLPGVLSVFWASGLFSGHHAVKRLRGLVNGSDLSSLKLPAMEIAVTDAVTHRPEILREGPLAELIVASCAVPGLITIQRVGDRRFIDGGVACEIPFEQWLDDPEVDTIVIHRIRHEAGSGPTVSWETVATSIGCAHQTVCNELHRHRVELARVKGKRLVEVDTITPAPGMFTQRRAPACYERGYESGKTTKW